VRRVSRRFLSFQAIEEVTLWSAAGFTPLFFLFEPHKERKRRETRRTPQSGEFLSPPINQIE